MGKLNYFDWAIFHSYVSHYQRVMGLQTNGQKRGASPCVLVLRFSGSSAEGDF